MGGDALCFDQGYIIHEQAHDPLAFARRHALVLPDAREIFGEIEDLPASFLIQHSRGFFAPLFVIGGGFAMPT